MPGKQQQPLLESLDPAIDHVCGPAAMLIVEYGDYECPYSRAAYRSIERIGARTNIRFAFRHLPLTEIHGHALAAATAAEAASLQGRFWGMHDLLFRSQNALERVRRDVRSGLATGEVLGTPTLFIDDAGYDVPTLLGVLGR